MTNPETDLHAPAAAVQTATAPVQLAEPADPYAAVSLPENSLLGADQLAVCKQTAAEVNLPAASLQKWLLLEESRLQAQARHQREEKQRTLEQWANQTQAQWGDKWQEEVSRAVRAADVFGGPELRQLLEETGLGNHPVMVRTFAGIGKRMSEDVTPGGATHAPADKTFTQALYGKN